jgi:hypothetical protein
MAEFLIDCSISPSLSSTSFDHKKISLSIGTVKKCKDFNKIDNNLITNKGVNIMVKTKVIECYILNADPEVLPGYRWRDLLLDLGRIECNVRNSVKGAILDEQDPLVSAEEILETLPELEFFENLPLTVTDDFFFEGLVSIIRTSILSLQSLIHKEKNRNLTAQHLELSNLKRDYRANFFQIRELEKSLTDQNELRLKEELSNYKVFDRLNSERITPFFMKLV